MPHARPVDQPAVTVVELRESTLVAGPGHPRYQKLVRSASHPEPSPALTLEVRPYRQPLNKHNCSRTLSHEHHNLLYAPDSPTDDPPSTLPFFSVTEPAA